LYRSHIVGLDLPGTGIDQSIGLLWWWCMQHMLCTSENRFIRTNAM